MYLKYQFPRLYHKKSLGLFRKPSFDCYIGFVHKARIFMPFFRRDFKLFIWRCILILSKEAKE